jgi:hypothetical protein
MERPHCVYCQFEDPVGGVRPFRTTRLPPDGCPEVMLCLVCANSLAVAGFLVHGRRDNDAVDRNFVANLLRRDIAGLR